MPNYGDGGGWSGPDRAYRGVAPFDPLTQAYESIRAARSGGEEQVSRGGGGGGRIQVLDDPDTAMEAELGRNPNILSPGQSRLSPDASPQEIERFATQPRSFQVGGRPYQYDPRLALGLEFAKERQARSGQMQVEANQGQLKQQENEARVRRLVSAGYAEKEATRQVFGGPRTVAEEQEIINTRSADQLSRDKLIQGDISARAQAAQSARAGLSQLLERSRSGDRNASRQLRAQQIILQDAQRAHTEALKARTANALGGVDLGAPGMDPADVQLNEAVNSHLDDVQSSEAARRGAVAGITRAANSGAPGADAISDADGAAFLGVRTPAAVGASSTSGDPLMLKHHAAFQRGTLPGQQGPGRGLKPAAKPLEDHMHEPAATDPGYRTWLQSKGYDVSTVKPPDDGQQDDEEL